MDDLLYRFLIKHKQLGLPGLGSFSYRREPAVMDVSNKAINAPSYHISFDNAHDEVSPGLYAWLAALMGTDEKAVKNRLDHSASRIKQQVKDGEKVDWQNAGTFFNDNGNIAFEPATAITVFDKPVPAEKVLRANSEHSMVVGEHETTSTQMAEYLSQQPASKKAAWWVWALIIALIAIAIAAWYFSTHGANTNAAGYQQKVSPEKAAPTYKQVQ